MCIFAEGCRISLSPCAGWDSAPCSQNLSQRHAARGKEVSAVLPHHEELVVGVLFKERMRLFEDVLIVRARKPFVRGHDEDAARALFLTRLRRSGAEIDALGLLVRMKHPCYLFLQRGEIRTRPLEVVLRLAHLGGCDEVHGVRYLLGVTDARDPVFYLRYAAHLPFSGDLVRRREYALFEVGRKVARALDLSRELGMFLGKG